MIYDHCVTCLLAGIIEALHKFYANNPKSVERYWLCSPVDHFSSTFSDKGWGCGYRNLQMVLSSLAQKDIFKEPLFNGKNYFCNCMGACIL